MLPGIVLGRVARRRPLTRSGETGRDGAVEVVEVEGLRDVVEGAQLEGFLGETDVFVGR
jgi:hypothetical protein